MDLASFKTVNAKVTTESKKDTYDVRIAGDKNSVVFTAHAFKAMDLLNNSLDERRFENTIALVTRPGNEGTFAKRVTGSKNKGKTFKNERLIADLREVGIEKDYLKLEFIGEQDGERFYLVKEFEGEVSVAEAEEAEAEASEETGVAEQTTDEVSAAPTAE